MASASSPKMTYTHLDVLLASPTEPLVERKRVRQLTRMFEGLHSLEKLPNPTPDDWECVSDAVMLMQALRDMNVVQDPEGAIEDAFDALGRAGYRSMSGGALRLDGPAINLLRGILEDYASVLEQIPARTMITAHRKAEKRVAEILKGKK